MKLGVLISGRGSNLQALLEAKRAGGLLQAEFAVVISNEPQARGLTIAREHGVPTKVLDHRPYRGRREEHDRAVVAELQAAGCEGIVLAGYMRLIGAVFFAAYRHRMLNIHPSLLPSFPGLHAQQQALDWGVKVSGCTVHFVDEGIDSGPIILQRSVPVVDDDTEESLAARILEQEHKAIVEAVDLFTRGRLRIDRRRAAILSSNGETP